MRPFQVPLFKLRLVNQVSEATQSRRGAASVSQVTAFERTTLDDISSIPDTRFTGRDDFNKSFGKLVREAAAMNPAQRRTGEFAFAIKQSLEAVDQYWNNCQQLSALSETFVTNGEQIARLEASLRTKPTEQDTAIWFRLLLEQVNIVEKAIREHEGQVQALERVVATQSYLDEDRRVVLRAWNYDTRIFLRSIGKLLKGDTATQNQIHALQVRLEVTRVRTWHYLEPSALNSSDNGELSCLRELWNMRLKLRNERKRITPVLDKCLELLKTRDPGSSLYYFVALNIFYAHSVAFFNEGGRFKEALSKLEIIEKRLFRLPEADGQPPYWKPVLKRWCDAATEAFQRMSSGPQQGQVVATVLQDPLLNIGRYP